MKAKFLRDCAIDMVQGKIYEVEEQSGNYTLKDDVGDARSLPKEWFEVVSDTPSLVGKKVRCINASDQYSTNSHQLVVGTIYTIKEVDTAFSTPRYRLEETGTCVFRADRFEMVEDAPSPKQTSKLDPDKQAMMKFFATYNQPNTCSKCSAPLPCRFHS
jgi:hypothetical protein